MQKGIAIALVLALAAAGGCGSECGSDDSSLSTPTLIVENRGAETAVLDLRYEHDGKAIYREVTLPAKENFTGEYPDLGTLRLTAGRESDGLLLLQETFIREDFAGGYLTVTIRP
jgi:hypothetical protein